MLNWIELHPSRRRRAINENARNQPKSYFGWDGELATRRKIEAPTQRADMLRFEMLKTKHAVGKDPRQNGRVMPKTRHHIFLAVRAGNCVHCFLS